MDRKAGQGKEEEESRARQQEEKRPVQEEEKTPACHGRGHHVVEQGLGEIRNTGDIPKHNKGNLQQANSQYPIKLGETQSSDTKISDFNHYHLCEHECVTVIGDYYVRFISHEKPEDSDYSPLKSFN
ncbi:hypothetical protein STEG23_020483 [Scotinomys teguina]